MAATTLNLELQELHTAVTGTSSHSMTIRTLAYPVTIQAIKITAKSEYYVTVEGADELQEIYGLIKITASGETFQSARFAVKNEQTYTCAIGRTFEKNTSVTIQVLFYRTISGTTSAKHLFYQGNISAENAKQPSYGLDITSTNAFYSQMVLGVNGVWSINEKNYGYPYIDYSNSEFFTVYAEPKRWDLWKTDEKVNDGYPYILDDDTRQNIDVFVLRDNVWESAVLLYKGRNDFHFISLKYY